MYSGAPGRERPEAKSGPDVPGREPAEVVVAGQAVDRRAVGLLGVRAARPGSSTAGARTGRGRALQVVLVAGRPLVDDVVDAEELRSVLRLGGRRRRGGRGARPRGRRPCPCPCARTGRAGRAGPATGTARRCPRGSRSGRGRDRSRAAWCRRTTSRRRCADEATSCRGRAGCGSCSDWARKRCASSSWPSRCGHQRQREVGDAVFQRGRDRVAGVGKREVAVREQVRVTAPGARPPRRRAPALVAVRQEPAADAVGDHRDRGVAGHVRRVAVLLGPARQAALLLRVGQQGAQHVRVAPGCSVARSWFWALYVSHEEKFAYCVRPLAGG